MSTMFVISYFALWALFLVQSFIILLLLRQVGVLHLRIAPTGARVMAAGPELGQPAPPVTLRDMDDPLELLQVTQPMEEDMLLLFVSPACAVCSSLMPAVKPLMRESKGNMRWAMVGLAGRQACHRFRQKYGLNYLFFAYSPKIRNQYKVGVTPYAVIVSKDGIVVSKGLVNQVEHLESLLEARNQIDSPAETRLLGGLNIPRVTDLVTISEDEGGTGS